jgi:threonine dehydrogenase-like Zn-dependent dehydrogenase
MNTIGLYTDPKLVTYRQGGRVPAKSWLWPLYGAGLENLGIDDQPLLVDLPSCGPDQLLVRHDAVGLCFSDTKVIKAGETHPRLLGRNMKTDPVVLGHEVTLTVVQVGADLTSRFHPGERYLVQADIYKDGVGMAYGYRLQGGLSQFNLVGPQVLDGDDGCYLLPVKQETGYAQAALTEPWACVVASYAIEYRVGWKPEGAVLIAAGPGAQGEYALGAPYGGGQPPRRVVAAGLRGKLLNELRAQALSQGFTLVEQDTITPETLDEIVSASGVGGFDDIVLLGPDSALYETVEKRALKGAVIAIIGAQALAARTQVDVGRIHYDAISIVGTSQREIAAAYGAVRTELLTGGKALFVGAAGPMGQMHVQRALQAADGPAVIVASDLVKERLDVLEAKYSQLIAAKRRVADVQFLVPGEDGFPAFNARIMAATGDTGYDDIVVMAPSAGVVAGSVAQLAPNAVMNIFAGLPSGTMAALDLGVVATKGIRFTGTSGSGISDMRLMLGAAESGRLDPNLSVTAVSGLKGAKEGLAGVVHQEYPGKVVIYPQILDFPLTRLEDLKNILPAVYGKLGPNESWTIEAEEQFLKELLP